MSKKVLILGRRNAGEKNDALQFASAFDDRSQLEVVGAYYEDVVLTIEHAATSAVVYIDSKAVDVTTFDMLILINWSHKRLYTDVAHSIALIADKAGKTVWNEELLHARSSTKISQLVELSDTDVLIPQTVFSLTPQLAEHYIDMLGGSFIAKDPLASRGRNNYLCHSWDEFMKSADMNVSYLLQQYIPNDHSDLRMFVLAKEPKLAILRRGLDESHLNNISAGAGAEIVPLDSLPLKILRDTGVVARQFRRDLCGIDFMRNNNTGDYVFLEINTTPQIVNGAFVAEKIQAFADALENEEK